MTYEQLLELSVDLMVKRDRWEWGESDEEFTAQDAQALRHINRIMWDIEDDMMQGHEDDEQRDNPATISFKKFYFSCIKVLLQYIIIV